MQQMHGNQYVFWTTNFTFVIFVSTDTNGTFSYAIRIFFKHSNHLKARILLKINI